MEKYCSLFPQFISKFVVTEITHQNKAKSHFHLACKLCQLIIANCIYIASQPSGNMSLENGAALYLNLQQLHCVYLADIGRLLYS